MSARDPRHRKQTRLEVEERAGKASAGVAPVESDRGRQRQVEDGGGYTDSRPSALASCEVHPVGKDGWVPRVGGKLEWVIAHAPYSTDVQPDIVLALGGWMSRMLQSERPDPALSAPGHRA